MATNPFIIRLRTKAGVKRLLFKDASATWYDLQLQVKDVIGVNPSQQRISRKELHAPEFVDARSSQRLADLRLKHGDMLFLDERTAPMAMAKDAKEATSTDSSKKPFKLTPRCTHPETARCLHCNPPEEFPAKISCKHGPGVTCLNCSQHVSDKEAKSPAPWLCAHAEHVFCPKCAPPITEDERLGAKKPFKCECLPGQKCSRCVDTGPAIKVDKIPFARFMEEKRALCKFKHAASVTCAFCAPPALPSYVGRANCNKGHAPWPQAVCLSCAPAVANIKEQPYRHCDSISLPVPLVQQFYANWVRRGTDKQRAAILFGRYMEEPAETKNPGAIRAQVHALYEPPQEPTSYGLRFLRDPDERIIHEVAALVGLEPVGWTVATMPREGEKYGGKVFMSGSEVQQAARFQNRYKNDAGFSRFMTVIIEHGENVEPRAYQVSDQCVAMERDGCLARAEDPNMIAAKPVKKGEMPTSIVYKNKPILPGTEFLPDYFIVKAVVSTSRTGETLFAHHTFPSQGADANMRTHMNTYSREEYSVKLSDFNLLVYLAKTIGMPLTQAVCASIRDKTPLSKDMREALDRAFLAKNLF